MKRQQSQVLMRAYLDKLFVDYGVELKFQYPDVPRIAVSVDDDPFLGAEDAPVTIIQFAEFQCPYCGRAGESVDQVMKEYEGKIKMVFRDFPLSFHDRAVPAAVAANCGGEQGKYWEMHKQMMANQSALSESDLEGYATKSGLDISKWQECRKDPKQEAEVQKDFEDGSKVGVTGTPAFFINGIMFSGAIPFEQFKEIIDRELNAG
jgi:protein-disulfide isomerase